MAEQSTTRHLRVVGAATRPAGARGDETAREAYWARLRALRAERERLRAG
ncbi:hypothetical protein [Knoellia aerolata]|uniref:Uncharacterized protein n=1 Tax=Knoellia aerolata DSM 18566 TaxID=1385519 RepID=A0A0A0K1P0_9MICO|nr:hypothetical protein [Knoellia aerolata]KGN41716.1 hypothetical protein N801_06070 [Knoellia aerolata DSM 18566]